MYIYIHVKEIWLYSLLSYLFPSSFRQLPFLPSCPLVCALLDLTKVVCISMSGRLFTGARQLTSGYASEEYANSCRQAWTLLTVPSSVLLLSMAEWRWAQAHARHCRYPLLLWVHGFNSHSTSKRHMFNFLLLWVVLCFGMLLCFNLILLSVDLWLSLTVLTVSLLCMTMTHMRPFSFSF